MSPVPGAKLRMRLLLLAASGLLPLVLVLSWGVDHLFEERREAAQRSALELSRALATAVDAEVHSIEALLEQMGTSDELERADLRSFHLAARRDAEQLGWRQVSLADGDGHLLFRSNQPFDNFDPKVVDAASLKQVTDTKRPLVTRVVESPKDKIETFAVRVPVLRGDQVVYVLTAVLPTEVIAKVLLRQGIPADSVASVFDQSGRRIARSRPSSAQYAAAPLQKLLESGATQGTGITRTVEGDDVYTGFTRLQDLGWAVTVGASIAHANRATYALLGAIGVGLAASLGLALLLAWVLARRVTDPIERLKSAAAALGRGDPVTLPPLGIAELDDVASALRTAA
ncbi:MAG TPA: cache and HAMP domain-containing protein, partial [Ramlibacter sp.]